MSTPTILSSSQERINTHLQHWLAQQPRVAQRLQQAINYVLQHGGKRIRPALLYATGHALEINPDQLDCAAMAIELIHTYSLVHDDLPAMDDDDLRRGVATCHIEFDEATAILVGDALLTAAFQLLSDTTTLHAEQRCAMITCLCTASGHQGMVGGQALDLYGLNHNPSLADIKTMYRYKTGALISASIQLAYLATPTVNQATQQQLDTFAEHIGLAFQIQDDILDIVTPTEELGKPQGSDAAKNKVTYASLVGLETAQAHCQELHTEALRILDQLPNDTTALRTLTDYLLTRRY